MATAIPRSIPFSATMFVSDIITETVTRKMRNIVKVISVTVNSYVQLLKLKFHYPPSADTSDIRTKLLTDTNCRSQN